MPDSGDRPVPVSAPPASSRWSTRDLIGPTLVFVGGFLIAAALALPTLLVGQMRLIPLSTDVTTVATSVGDPEPNATILDRCSLNSPAARTVGAELVRQQRVVAVQPSDKRVVTLQAGTSVQAERIWLDGRGVDADTPRPGSEQPAADGEPACTDATLSAIKDRVTLGRRTALPDLGANSSGVRGNSEIQYDSHAAPVQVPDRTGYTYVLPFGTDADGLRFFDPVSRRSVPLVHTGTTQVDGRTALRFVADVPDTDLDAVGAGAADTGVPATRITRPASWFGVGGDPARPLTATLHQTSRWEIAVDEATGVIVDERIDVDQAYRIADPTLDGYRLTNLTATFAYDRQTRADLADQAQRLGTPLVIWGRVVPIAAGVLGVLAVVGGAVLTVRGRGDAPDHQTDQTETDGTETGQARTDADGSRAGSDV
ncbi:DUF3068 domain-containing protein [Gordonia sp. NB41Y]|uniref:DUF3068 domain-containing protein n=1 Tax=Gordonia sp. NB41Y TaxID=875808 RepID=UPI0009EA82CA|nr:DUF3068 domain-containing protein [Gordonia sp. NB41Y]WLP88933.1 DUF3068 domain-containing protein [Gordonia sp. NB41Y]